jgi:2-dehydropantoate 2-reductase
MRLCVYGAGAIGGQIGAQLAATGVDVTLIARGPHLAAMQKNGLRLITPDDDFTVHPRCTDDPNEAGQQDYVFVALKAHSVPGIVDQMQPLFGPETAVVTAVNGIPWWYFHQHPGNYQDHQLESVDPGGRQWAAIGPERAIGCVVWQAAEILEPGVVRLNYGSRMPIGEPNNERSERAMALSKALIAAGSKSPVKKNIRDEIWMKLWGNLSFNPMSLLTQATLQEMADDAATRTVIREMMLEASAIAEKLGVRFAMDVDKRIDSAGEVGAHKTSMLQDLELGRPIELDALTGVVSELGRLTGVATPTIDTIYATTRLRARQAGIYPET